MKHWSIKYVTAGILASAFFLFGIILIFIFTQESKTLAFDAFDHEQTAKAELLGISIANAVSNNDYEGLQRVVELVKKDPDIQSIVVLDEGRDELARYPKKDEPNKFIASDAKSYNLTLRALDKKLIGYLRLSATNEAIASSIDEKILYGALLLASLGGFFLMFIFILLDKVIASPISKLSRAVSAQADAAENNIAIPYVSRRNEVGALAAAFQRVFLALEETTNSLRASEGRLQAILRNSPALVALSDLYGKYILVNEQFERLLNEKASNVVGKTNYAFLAADSAEEIQRHESMVLAAGHSLEFEEVWSVGGKSRIYLSNRFPLPDAFGKPQALCCIGADITDRKMVETALRESENRYKKLYQEFQALLDAIPDSLLLLSRDLEILWANTAAVKELNRPISAIQGRHCHDLRHGKPSRCFACPIEKSFETAVESTLQISSDDGRCFEVKAFPVLDENEAVRCVIEVWVDITTEVTSRAEAMHSARLASLGEMAAGLAHEINNPINSIINYAQLLIDEAKSNGEDNEIAGRILKDGDRVASIVRSLLSFARSGDEGKNPFYIHDLLSNALTLTGAQIRRDGISLRVDCSKKLPLLFANQQQIEQVILNIINNARYALNQKFEHPHADKVLEIKAETIHSGADSQVRLTFFDHGAGIPSDIKDKIINPFFTTKEKGAGTGLGLSMTKSILDHHGGNISIDSVEGEFCVVNIDLPVGRFHQKDELAMNIETSG